MTATEDLDEAYLDPAALPRIAAEAGPHTTALARRAVTALERIADSLEKLEELPKRLRSLELAIDQKDLR